MSDTDQSPPPDLEDTDPKGLHVAEYLDEDQRVRTLPDRELLELIARRQGMLERSVDAHREAVQLLANQVLEMRSRPPHGRCALGDLIERRNGEPAE